MFNFPQNMAGWDRAIRTLLAILGVVGFGLGIVSGTIGYAIILVALIFLITSLIGFCPLYTLLNFSTKKLFSPKAKAESKKK